MLRKEDFPVEYSIDLMYNIIERTYDRTRNA